VWSFFGPPSSRDKQIVVGLTAFAAILAAVVSAFATSSRAGGRPLPDELRLGISITSRSGGRDYLSFAAVVCSRSRSVFEVPIVILGLVRIGILSSAKPAGNRRIATSSWRRLRRAFPASIPCETTMEIIPLMLLFGGSIWLAVLWSAARRTPRGATLIGHGARSGQAKQAQKKAAQP